MQKKPKGVRGYILFKLLTAGIYTTFTRALREAASNAYDAGATKVDITFNPPRFVMEQDPAKLTIQIRDDGKGMSAEDFWGKFASIDSHKDPSKKDPETGRYPIGRFGIGSFALVPFALTLTIWSKKKGCPPIKCVINAAALQEEGHEDFPDHVQKNIVEEEITEDAWQTLFLSDKPGTVIVINGVTRETLAELRNGSDRDEEHFKGLYPEAKFTKGLKEIAWELSTILPIGYAEDPGEVYKDYRPALQSNNPGIRIKLSGVELKRHIYSGQKCIVKQIDYHDKEQKVKAKGVILALSDGVVQPLLARGVILRLNNVGVGNYRSFDVTGNATLKNRITGEVHIVQGLHQDINAPRENFSGPPFDALAKHIREKIEELISEAGTKHKSKKHGQEEREEKKVAARFVKLREERHAAAAPAAASSASSGPTPGSNGSGSGTPSAQQSKKATPAKPAAKGSTAPPLRTGANASTNAAAPAAPAAPQGSASPSPAPAQAAPFLDPIISIDDLGHVTYRENHRLFRIYSGKKERSTIRLVLRALRLENIPVASYQRIINDLLALKADD